MSFINFLKQGSLIRVITRTGIYLGVVNSIAQNVVLLDPYLDKDLITYLKPWISKDSSYNPMDYSVPYSTAFSVDDIKEIMILKPCQNPPPLP